MTVLQQIRVLNLVEAAFGSDSIHTNVSSIPRFNHQIARSAIFFKDDPSAEEKVISFFLRSVSMNEKPYQILDESRKPLHPRPGDIGKIDSDYVRNGNVTVFC